MAARAIWKGVIRIGRTELPVKFYSAVQDRSVHFRLLHRTDLSPVKQKLVDPDTDGEVSYSEVRKAFPVSRRELVVLEAEDLESIEPKESRDVEISRFVPLGAIDHRWYERAYFLGPDGNSGAYFAAAAALARKKREGVARWVMRKKEYVGALRSEDGYLMLITLRHADEIIDADALPRPEGRALDKREVQMAEQLVRALEGRFEPGEFRDEYRARVMELVETKSKGGRVKVKPFRQKKTGEDAVSKALQASLAGLKATGTHGR